MACKKEMIALLLAGGQGSRLKELTEATAKPAVTFGGKYKIIDFPLSNCFHSGIDTVGVLTQYQPLALNEYLGNGEPWDLDRAHGGLSVLPPFQGRTAGGWYLGTADAVYRNLEFIRQFSPDYVLILSGDHIYSMDYGRMLRRHKLSGAVCTVATVEVSPEDASRYGICEVAEDGTVIGFEEKPERPKSRLASMGIYIFTTGELIRALEEDERDPESAHDFGKNILPKLLLEGQRVVSFAFDGYWRDVGTVASLWQANMDLLGETPVLRPDGERFRPMSRHYARAPQVIGHNAAVSDSVITEARSVCGTVTRSVLSGGVTVEEGAEVTDSVIMENVTVCRGAKVCSAIVDADSVILPGSVVGKKGAGAEDITVVARGSTVRPGTDA